MGCAVDAAEGEGVLDGGVAAGAAAGGEPVVDAVDGLLRGRPAVAETPLMGAPLLEMLDWKKRNRDEQCTIFFFDLNSRRSCFFFFQNFFLLI